MKSDKQGIDEVTGLLETTYTLALYTLHAMPPFITIFPLQLVDLVASGSGARFTAHQENRD